jgi:hypothetical protein
MQNLVEYDWRIGPGSHEPTVYKTESIEDQVIDLWRKTTWFFRLYLFYKKNPWLLIFTGHETPLSLGSLVQ